MYLNLLNCSKSETEKLRKIALVLFLGLIVSPAFGQKFKASLHFLSDTTRIGRPVLVSVTFTHPIHVSTIFPDSAYDFSPMEFISKKYFPTRSDSVNSTDSAVYELATYEILPSISYSLPLLAIDKGDSSTWYTDTDEIDVLQEISKVPQQPVLKENTDYLDVNYNFNYPYVLVGLGVVLVLVLVVLIFFRKKIARSIRLYFIRRQFFVFIQEFDRMRNGLENQWDTKSLEKVLTYWKAYLEKLENVAYTTFTSREIERAIPFPRLYDSLLNIDRCIYGGAAQQETSNSLKTLREVVYARYQKKTQELTND